MFTCKSSMRGLLTGYMYTSLSLFFSFLVSQWKLTFESVYTTVVEPFVFISLLIFT